MGTPLINRFQYWLGVWRGPITWSDGRSALMQFRFEPAFNGQAIEVRTVAFDADGAVLTCGHGFLSLGRDGRVVNNMYYNLVGFALLHEVPDDPGMLSLQGPLPGNRRIDIAMYVEGDDFSLSSRITEGYAARDEGPRTVTHMRRIGPPAPAGGSP
ncbi:MAG: hypothetical protein M5U25_16040 [Planctomycetota bacterium]|nr:hypothetical protein [Planctomycetota bacterium]